MFSARKQQRGFTLAELLITVQMVAVIATFTIPKVVNAQASGSNNAKMKEMAATLAAAYQRVGLVSPITSSFKPSDLTPFLNYVRVDSSTAIDTYQGGGTVTCGTGITTCVLMHNGSMLRWDNNYTLGGTNTTNGFFFSYDPDGYAGGSKAVQIFIYYNGRMSTWAQLSANSVNSANTITPCGTCDPPWVDW